MSNFGESVVKGPEMLHRIDVLDPTVAAILRGKTEAERLAIAWGM